MQVNLVKMLRRGCLLAALSAVLLGNTVLAEECEVNKASRVGVAVSVMLLGSISFMMSLFYLVNHPDQDMKRYSWQVISSTISIFCAVLIFQGCNGIVEEYILDGHSALFIFVGNTLHMILWFLGLQLVLAIASGAIGPAPESLEEVELKLKCWAVLFAHLTGFASINAFGSLQHLPFFSHTPLHSLLAVPIGGLVLYGLYNLMNTLREKVALGDDGTIDDFERKWDQEAEEAENDIAGLSLSFLTVQVLRFWISGILPNVEGVEPAAEAWSHSTSEVYKLIGAGLAFAAVTIVAVFAHKLIPHGSERLERIIDIVQNFCSMGFAWSLFYGTKWGLSAANFTTEETLLRVCLAMFLSFVSFCIIFVLDKIADMDATGSDADEAIRTIIAALGILVGFSWEQSFDTAVDSITDKVTACPPAMTKLVISLCLVGVVLPAWRLYILQIVLILDEEEMEKEEQQSLEGYQELMDKCDECRQGMQYLSTSEADVDMRHLEIKQLRRVLRGETYSGLLHFRVTVNGVSEVKPQYRSPSKNNDSPEKSL